MSDGYKIYAVMTVPDGPVPAAGWPAIIFNHGYTAAAQYRTTERYVAYQDRLSTQRLHRLQVRLSRPRELAGTAPGRLRLPWLYG